MSRMKVGHVVSTPEGEGVVLSWQHDRGYWLNRGSGATWWARVRLPNGDVRTYELAQVRPT